MSVAHVPIRVGVVGCGEIAQVMHLPLLLELPEYAIGGLCDLSGSVVDHLGEQYGVALGTTDYRSSSAPTRSTRSSSAPTTTRRSPRRRSRPASTCWSRSRSPSRREEARPLVEAAEASGLVALIGYMKLYDRAVERAIEEVAALEGIRALHVHDFAGRFDRHPELYAQIRGDDVPQELLDRLARRGRAAHRGGARPRARRLRRRCTRCS